jgi:nitronate monooxygenase
MRDLEPGDVLLHKFSPTGFYSSAVKTGFLMELVERSDRQIPYSKVEAGEHTKRLDVGVKGKNFWVAPRDLDRARTWFGAGFTEGLRTPDDTIIFVSPEERRMIQQDQKDCMGCLSHCGFSAWKDHDDYTTGRLADPRSFCIQKTLQDIAHGGDVEKNLMFAGHAAYRFKQDPFYSNNYTPTVKELVDRILTGD